jgi:UDP-N-acetylmuramoyl-tripeptide--D-alanyl-D-alanine ligase
MITRLHATAGEIAGIVGGNLLSGNPRTKIEHVSSDSRESDLRTLFVPIRGEKFDGHSFIEQLAREGKISCFLTERDDDALIAATTGIAAIKCGNTLFALGAIGKAHRTSSYQRPLVAITGTNGKTTTKELVAALLSSKYRVHKSEKNYNNEIGVPFALMELSSDHQASVIEMGMNHAGEISRLSRMACPTIGVITNAGEGHLEFLGSVENVARAKAEIVEGMTAGSTIIINEETACFEILRDAGERARLNIVTVGIEKGMMKPFGYRLHPLSIEIDYDGITIECPLYGIHNITNIMAALAVGRELGVTTDDAAQSLKCFSNVGRRSDVIEGVFVVLNDTYNSNPLSVHYALRSLSEIYPDRRRIAVLADMKELGDLSVPLHMRVGSEVHRFGFSDLFTHGPLAEHIAHGALKAGMLTSNIRHFSSKEELIDALRAVVRPGDAILVKGSRSMKMEEVADSLVRS